jgi:hypothetical protein
MRVKCCRAETGPEAKKRCWRVVSFERRHTAMSSGFHSSIGSHIAAIAVGAFAATVYLTVYSASRQSLADYISMICAKSFGSAPTAEAPYLAENVSAMTKMMIDMGIKPSGDVDTDFVAMMCRTIRVPSRWLRLSCVTDAMSYSGVWLRKSSSPSYKRSLQCGCRLAKRCRRPYYRPIRSRPRQRTIRNQAMHHTW